MSDFGAFLCLFIMVFLGILIFLMFNTSETYVTLASKWGVIVGLTLIFKIPVRLLRRISPTHFVPWKIEQNPPDWVSEKVLYEKNRISWMDRARFWYLILSYGTKSAHQIVGSRFLPQLFAHIFWITFRRIRKILLEWDRSARLFAHNPLISYLHFAGSLSAGALNWISESIYHKAFLTATRDAAQKFGHHEALRLMKTGWFPGNSVKTLMAMIMYIYVVYGLVSWMRYCYPRTEPLVEATDTYSIVRFCQGPYECPHRGLKYPGFCHAFVSWEAALAETVNPKLTAIASKRAIAGDPGCEVTVRFKK